MKFLFDTNILIPIELTSVSDREPTTPIIASLIKLISSQKSDLYIHPGSLVDLKRDENQDRLRVRLELLGKYRELPSPPSIPQKMSDVIGPLKSGSNHEIDALLLASVYQNAVDFLVTNDDGMHRRAFRLGIDNRVLTASDAVDMLQVSQDAPIESSRLVSLQLCHELDIADPIFNSLRADYDGFDNWFKKIQLEHRKAFTIVRGDRIGAIAILKEESQGLLKICTFKVAEFASGVKLGELLLKSIFDLAIKQKLREAFLTVFPKQTQLILLLEDFGFRRSEELTNGELVMSKPFVARAETTEHSPLSFHVRFGPNCFQSELVDKYVVPIQPTFHRMLFPDLERQLELFPNEFACGNGIKKAYICRSAVKQIAPGSILLFYRSEDSSKIRAVGVVDKTLRTNSAEEIIRFVGKRTVYTTSEVNEICQTEAIAILFRYAKEISPISLNELIREGALAGVPQQITRTKPEADGWIRTVLSR